MIPSRRQTAGSQQTDQRPGKLSAPEIIPVPAFGGRVIRTSGRATMRSRSTVDAGEGKEGSGIHADTQAGR